MRISLIAKRLSINLYAYWLFMFSILYICSDLQTIFLF